MTEMRVRTAAEPDGWTIFANPPVRGRRCGSCKLCCTLAPVEAEDFQKPANVKCEHVCAKGCGIYARRPEACAYWSCRWLIDPDTSALRRPDLAGYVIDPQRETIRVNGQEIQAIQVYVDPARPDAHRDPALRAYLALLGQRFMIPTIVRWSNEGNAMLLVPPALTGNGTWREQSSELVSRETFAAGRPGEATDG